MKIDDILRSYRRPRRLFDQVSVKDSLLADLRGQRTFNNRIYIVLLSGITVLYLIAMAGLALDLIKNEAARITILATSGAGIPFILNLTRQIIGEWTKSNLLITVVGYSDENGIQLLIEKLLASEAVGLSPPRSGGQVGG